MSPTALPSRMGTDPPASILTDVMSGSMGMRATTRRSWNMRMDRVFLPWGEVISDRSSSILSTMAVELMETRTPRNSDSGRPRPNMAPTKYTAAAVSTTWTEPPTRTVLRLSMRSLMENSIPMEKSRSTTPSSERASTSLRPSMMPRAWGPARTPVRRNPRTAGSLTFMKARMTMTLRPITMMRWGSSFVSMARPSFYSYSLHFYIFLSGIDAGKLNGAGARSRQKVLCSQSSLF